MAIKEEVKEEVDNKVVEELKEEIKEEGEGKDELDALDALEKEAAEYNKVSPFS